MNSSVSNNSHHFLPSETELGYKYFSRQNPNDPGHPRLDIVLRPIPTLRHFDPETLLIRVISNTGGIESHIIHHPWRSQQVKYKIVAGRITWQDRIHKVKEAISFGADLEIISSQEKTLCSLTSSAPIIPLTDDLSVPTLLALEVETLLAVRRAAWIHNMDGYIQRLCAANSLNLYRACLNAVSEKLGSLDQAAMTEPISQLLYFIHHERGEIQQESQATLIDLL